MREKVDNSSAENDEILQQDDCQEHTARGVLWEFEQKRLEREAIKEKRKTVYQALKYALCAISAGVIQIVSFTILNAVLPSAGKTIHFIVEDMDVVTFVATTVALCLSILWNFTLNRKFTFKDAGNVPKAMILAFLFYVPFYPFQTWCVHAVKTALVDAGCAAGIAGVIGEATAMVCNFVLEFLWQKFVVFRKPKDGKKGKEEKEQAEQPSQQ